MPSRRDVLGATLLISGAAIAGTGVGLLPGSPMRPTPKRFVMIGDSIGVGMASAAGIPNHAQVGTKLRGGSARLIAQVGAVPPLSDVIISLGTNDAYLNHMPFTSDIMWLVGLCNSLGKARSVTWVGPPRIKASWDDRAAAVGAALAGPLPLPQGMPLPRYVSLRALDVRGLARSPDGVHFTAHGYKVLWDFVNHQIGS